MIVTQDLVCNSILKPRLHEHVVTYPGSAQPMTSELRLSAGSCVYTNASIRRLLAFFVNKQSRRRRSNFRRLADRRAASIFLPWYILSSQLQNRAEAINLHLAWVGMGPNTVTQTELGQHAFILEPSRAQHV